MSDKMRWRYGDTNPVIAGVLSETVIEIGDLVFQENDDCKPASMVPDMGSVEETQKWFANRFLGVAMQRSRPGDTEPIRVYTAGVHEFDCPTGTFRLGELIGCQAGPNRDCLKKQEVIMVYHPRFAIGRVAKREPCPACTVFVEIKSTIMTGGVEGSSYSS